MKFNVLIVDDENIREGLGTALDMDGYRISLAADGKEAINLINSTDMNSR